MRFLALATALYLIATSAAAEQIGAARVIDGDTLEINGSYIRLHGVDAPERGQLCARDGEPWTCGRAAAELLRDLTRGKDIACEERSRTVAGEVVARCRAGWMDLGAEMVTRGMAVATLTTSRSYLQNYREARGKGNGIFAGEFVDPADWRQGERHAVEIASRSVSHHCLIKGAIDGQGEQIYYLPEQRAYAVERINPGVGERWFCDEATARAAGWRRHDE